MTPSLLDPPHNLFFTGKGGVGKTTAACATALRLADMGKSVLLVSTDPASNLDEMLQTPLGRQPTPVSGVPNLHAINIDPGAASDAYRQRVLAQMDPADGAGRSTVLEQLSGACTTEIAAFDEFVGLLGEAGAGYDHVVFDTAPTGHTLRLLSLPKAWTGFLAGNDRGASCLGPHSGLKMQESRFRAALEALGDPLRTLIALVVRPEASSIREADRTSGELGALGLANILLVVNGVFRATDRSDRIAVAIEELGAKVLADLPAGLRQLPQFRIPMHAVDMVGIGTLRAALGGQAIEGARRGDVPAGPPEVAGLPALVDSLASAGKGLIMVMGKGGVGKTTVAAAIAVGLVRRGHAVHLSTTDPAAHVAGAVGGGLAGLKVDRIDPKAETAAYVDKILSSRGKDLDAEGLALLREDLASPCTEEVAVFHAFSRIVAEARGSFVVLDTAPTGHTLLLMDATGAYHRQMLHGLGENLHGRVVTPLMRIQDADYSKIIVVTLPETTPVSEAAALQDDLRRAKIEPHAWVINRALAGTGVRDAILVSRLEGEARQTRRASELASGRLYALPWQPEPPVGVDALTRITGSAG